MTRIARGERLRQVKEVLKAHPDWKPSQIAAAIGSTRSYVDKTLRRQGIAPQTNPTIATAAERERCAKVAERWNAPRIAAAIRAG